ncbi:MAG: hypothetical protein DRQ55_13690 [Planctomycetota bacterium]|nr:MAG: hypothetical protein DRQ55_13690 [Planctomycetota bacterium]
MTGTPEVQVDLSLTDANNAHVIQNLWPLYLADLCEFDGELPNRHGILHDDTGDITTLAEQGQTLAPWWKEPGSLLPYLILADGRPAGFNLIAARARLPASIDADFVVHEFFVMRCFRGTGVAEQAAAAGLAAHRGSWEIVTYPNHPRAIGFWRKVLREAVPAGPSEQELDHHWGRRVVFRFDNGRQANAPET